jgi:aspartyl-tRNA(Asn)/glutamyl-tRNA(Gln) amidotransferase subunit A
MIENERRNLKIGYSFDLGFAQALEPEVEKSVFNAIQKFEDFGWSIEKSKIKLRDPESTFSIIWSTGFAYSLGPYMETAEEKMDPGLVDLIKLGYKFSTKEIKIAEIQREIIYQEICRAFKKFDVLITPTLACPAFELGKSKVEKGTGKTGVIINGKPVSSEGWLPFTYPFNASGHPAASIPCGWTSKGLPVGMQIVGNRFDELTVLQVSKIFEDINPWRGKKPDFN